MNRIAPLKMNLKYVFATLLLFISVGLYAHEDNRKKTEHDHHQNEIGLANSIVYFIKDKSFANGLHFHFQRSIPNSKFGIGIGYERIFDIHQHNSIGLIGAYRPIENLSFNFSPGMTYEGYDKTVHFAFHVETTYEWEFKNFHLGPTIEFAYDLEDYHISLGIHIGYGF